jgi:hypothetical protein
MVPALLALFCPLLRTQFPLTWVMKLKEKVLYGPKTSPFRNYHSTVPGQSCELLDQSCT